MVHLSNNTHFLYDLFTMIISLKLSLSGQSSSKLSNSWWILTITLAHIILFTANLKSSTEIIQVHCLKVWSRIYDIDHSRKHILSKYTVGGLPSDMGTVDNRAWCVGISVNAVSCTNTDSAAELWLSQINVVYATLSVLFIFSVPVI